MKYWLYFINIITILLLTSLGCAVGKGDTVTPGPESSLKTDHPATAIDSGKYVWGYYDVYLPAGSMEMEVVPDRSVMFAVNATTFINPNPAGITVEIVDTSPGSGYIDVDAAIGIKHPLNNPGYDGYDVMGVFIGGGWVSLNYGSGIFYAEMGKDQILMNPDGYTRWFNPEEFTGPGPAMFKYTPGTLATPGYKGDAIINPYKLFADSLDDLDDAWEFVSNMDGNGNNVFSAGKMNYRRYIMRFPLPNPGVKFNYAVVASWKGEQPDDHPANTHEVVAATADIDETLYYINSGKNGGIFRFDFSLAGYGDQPDTIYLDSTVLTALQSYNPADILTDSGTTSTSYHIETMADHVTGTSGNTMFLIAEYDDYDYTLQAGVPNDAEDDKLAAFFEYDVPVTNGSVQMPPVIVSGIDGEENPLDNVAKQYSVDAYDVNPTDILTYSFDVIDLAVPEEVLSDDPGNGDGTIDLTFADFNGKDEGQYEIRCDVSDGKAVTKATPLTVSVIASTRYLYDAYINGDGGMSRIAGDLEGWAYIPALYAWDESHAGYPYPNNQCTVVATPAMSIPNAGAVHLRLSHWDDMDGNNDGVLVGYTLDNGDSYTWHDPDHNIFQYYSGLNFSGYASFQGNMQTCADGGYIDGNWTYKYFTDHNGSQTNFLDSDFTCNSLLDTESIRFCLKFVSNGNVTYQGFRLRELEVYITE